MLEGTHNIPTCRGRNVIFGEPAVTAGGTGIALAEKKTGFKTGILGLFTKIKIHKKSNWIFIIYHCFF